MDLGQPTWRELAETFPPELIGAFQTVEPVAAFNLGIRQFLHWVGLAENETAQELKRFFTGSRANYRDPGLAILLRDSIVGWTDEMLAGSNFKQNTVRHRRGKLIAALETLNREFDLRLPTVSSGSFHFPTPTDDEPRIPLSDLSFPEFHGHPRSDWDQIGLELIKGHAKTEFDTQDKLFQFGQGVLFGGSERGGKATKHFDAFRSLLEAEFGSWEKHRTSLFSKPMSDQVLANVGMLKSPDVWRHLGYEPERSMCSVHGTIDFHAVAEIIVAGVGPTNRAAKAVQARYAASTGWNRRQTQFLGANPYLYKTQNFIRIGSQRFTVAFKARAGHFVIGTEEQSVSRGIELENLDAVWDELLSDPEFRSRSDVASVSASDDLATMMARYTAMTDACRRWCDDDTRKLYFVSISRRYGGTVSAVLKGIGFYLEDGPITRKGVTFSAVRKSYIATVDRSGATTDETRLIAGHHGSGSLEKHYRVDPAVRAKLMEGMRFFQQSIEAISIDDDIAIRIDLPLEQKKWFTDLAQENGIAAACGLGAVASGDDMNPDLPFLPRQDQFLELYLAHRALKEASYGQYYQRWLVQGRPLLEIVLAVGAVIFAKGFRAEYKEAARIGRRLLAAGSVSLPPVLVI